MEKSDREKHLEEIRRLARRDRVNSDQRNREILSRSRSVLEDIGLPYIGKRVMQIHYYPSFEASKIWDIREKIVDKKKTYSLFLNVLENHTRIAPGYTHLAFPSEDLEKIIQAIGDHQFALKITEPDMLGLDGVSYGVTIYSNFGTKLHAQWWGDVDKDFKELSHLIQEIVAMFQSLEASQ